MKHVGWLACLCLLGCARGPNVSGDLPLKRVVVYRNGVGYFEREGHVDEERVAFRMRQRMVGDFLASLAVIERGGSSVRSASFPLEVEETTQPEPKEPEPQPRPLDGEGPRPSEPKPPEPPKKPDPQAMREVLLHLDGKEHDLAIGYLAETPVWRPSYRVVVAPDGKADLQAWGIVQNLSGEDWNGVTLSLVAGAPLAFQSTLGTPVIPERPVVTDQGEVVAVVPTGVTSLDLTEEGFASGIADRYAGGVSPEPAPAPEQSAAYDRDEAKREAPEAEVAGGVTATSGSMRRLSNKAAAKPAAQATPGGLVAPPPPPMAPRPAPTLSAPRRLSDLAAVAIEAGTTRYDIPYPVTVPNDSATMVLLTSQRVPGAAVLLFAPEPGVEASSSHPFRVARFTNTTPGLLERGPIAVFEKASFLGQGMLEPLPPRATATVPFALERGVAVTSELRVDQQGSRLFRIEGGALYIERDSVQRTRYLIDNGSDRPMKLLVKHPRQPGARLFKPPAGTEDNVGTLTALIPIELRTRGKAELTVDERRANQEMADWLDPLADDAVRGYLADPRANPAIAQKLKDAWVVREALRKHTDEFNALSKEREELERLTDETRRSLRAIEKNPQAADLRQKLTKRLSDASTRIDAITKRGIELRMSIDEQQVRFRDAVLGLKLEAPLPPKD
ncbi:MAG: hypothetical protein M3020_23715 [Myxococcota bacterium]|nr:hypothetical protein [Myxococcota bacterium]